MRLVDASESQDKGRSAWLHHGYRYHITRAAAGSPLASSWWKDEDAARARFAAVVAELGDRDGVRAALVDEETDTVLEEWPGVVSGGR